MGRPHRNDFQFPAWNAAICLIDKPSRHMAQGSLAEDSATVKRNFPSAQLLLILLLFAASCLASNSAWATVWKRYTNPRFGASAEYPVGLFVPQPPPANGDGESFASSDGTMTLSIFGSFIVLTDDFLSYRDYRLSIAREDGVEITYTASDKNWLVYSGKKDERIYYFKMISACEGTAASHVALSYPVSRKAEMDKIAAHIAKSLRSEKGSECP